MAAGKEMEVEGKSASELYSSLIDKGLSASEASVLVAEWILESMGKTKRTFAYKESFPATQPSCGPAFSRSFHHTPWVDGEDVVQAGQTTGEEGFNLRFHRIEDDLDALGADVASAFTCLAAMRRSLRALLDEIRAEINQINATIYACCTGREATVVSPGGSTVVPGGHFVGTTVFGDKHYSLWETEKGLMILPEILTVDTDLEHNPRAQRAADLARYAVDNGPKLKEFFAERRGTKAEFVRRFGGDRTSKGQPVRELVAILPDSMSYESMQQMVVDVADREAAAMRTSGSGASEVAMYFGIETTTETVAQAPIDRMQSIPPLARSALLRNGINTVKQLADAGETKVAGIVSKEGVQGTTLADAAAWTALALTFSKVR